MKEYKIDTLEVNHLKRYSRLLTRESTSTVLRWHGVNYPSSFPVAL
jgi:hypothetical protein